MIVRSVRPSLVDGRGDRCAGQSAFRGLERPV